MLGAKGPRLLLAPALALPLSIIGVRISSLCGAYKERVPAASSQAGGAKDGNSHAGADDPLLIEPARRVGPLKLGDTRERALELFPRKPNVDKGYVFPNCGAEYEWADPNPSSGNVFISFKEGLVWQIDTMTTRYHTAEGLTSYSSPEEVRRYYKNLRAYLFLGPPSEAVGGRPPIIWMDREKGIAFSFAYYREEHRRYLYEIIVFKPKSDFCLEGYSMDPSNLRELAPYSLEAPNRSATRVAPAGGFPSATTGTARHR